MDPGLVAQGGITEWINGGGGTAGPAEGGCGGGFRGLGREGGTMDTLS